MDMVTPHGLGTGLVDQSWGRGFVKKSIVHVFLDSVFTVFVFEILLLMFRLNQKFMIHENQ